MTRVRGPSQPCPGCGQAVKGRWRRPSEADIGWGWLPATPRRRKRRRGVGFGGEDGDNDSDFGGGVVR